MGGQVNKVFLPLGDRPLLARTLEVFEHCPRVNHIYLVVADRDRKLCTRTILEPYRLAKLTRLVSGGETRQESVLRGVLAYRESFKADDDVVLVHDGARPLLLPVVLGRVITAAGRHGAAAPVIPSKDTVKVLGSDGFLRDTPDRRRVGLVQTPQGFQAGRLVDVLTWAARQGLTATDEAALFEARGLKVKAVAGSEENLKVTTPGDLTLAQAILAARDRVRRTERGRDVAGVRGRDAGKASPGRVGFGYDIHRLAPGRRLVLCGVEFSRPDGLGLDGHSDADVAVHAIMDALLGAAGLPDIGSYFPTGDRRYAGTSSLDLLGTVVAELEAVGLAPVNVDLTVVAEAPKILPRVEEMRAKLAEAARLGPGAVGIKATTAEGLGPVGEGRGIAAYAVASVAESRRRPPGRRR
jgi:2-C-methyl-D-erythritol 4-phosphate cytidylyltransferase/2-C-methyl-D-erythritol 2,4-cyclodiphosphate synthase